MHDKIYVLVFYEDCIPHYFHKLSNAKHYAELELGYEIPWDEENNYNDICYIITIEMED